MLALLKDLPRAFTQRASGRLDRRAFRGRAIAGKTLGVVGLGGIGREVARLGRALGMRVVGTRWSTEPVEHVEALFRPSELLEVLAQSDVVVVAAQLTSETYHVIGDDALGAMKPGAVLINVARGDLIDEVALLAALHSGRLGGFAADVYEGEFEHPPPAGCWRLKMCCSRHISPARQTTRRADRWIFFGRTCAAAWLASHCSTWWIGNAAIEVIRWARS